jgi:hypothetical protein
VPDSVITLLGGLAFLALGGALLAVGEGARTPGLVLVVVGSFPTFIGAVALAVTMGLRDADR